MKILLLGANGQVGHELRRSLAPLGTVVTTTRSGELPDGTRCEVANFDDPNSLAELVNRLAPDLVVNAAAYTAVDRAEDDQEAAFRANAEAPGVLAAICAQREIPFVHFPLITSSTGPVPALIAKTTQRLRWVFTVQASWRVRKLYGRRVGAI